MKIREKNSTGNLFKGFVSLAVLGTAIQPLHAQTSSQPNDTGETQSTNAEEETSDENVIVVTGSRLQNPSFSGITPIQSVSLEDAEARGDVLAQDIIRSSSVATGSAQVDDSLAASGPGGAVVAGGLGVNTISIRGLGTQRSLTVLNGRRIAPSGIQAQIGSADLGALPDSALARVDIIKDGASSIYGSDAIAGVVNAVTRSNYDGGSIRFTAGLPLDGAGENLFVSGHYGKTFDRGWIAAAATFSKQYELRVNDRDYLNCTENLVVETGTDIRGDLRNPDGSFVCRNHNPSGAVFFGGLAGTWIPDPNDTLDNAPGNFTANLPGFENFGRTGLNFLADVDARRASFLARIPTEDSQAFQNSSAISPNQRINIFINGAYEISDNVELFGEFLYNRRDSSNNGFQFLFGVVNPFNPNNIFTAGLAPLTGPRPAIFQLVQPVTRSTDLNFYQGTAGLRGTLGGDRWNWSIYSSYGVSDATYDTTFFYQDRINAISAAGTTCDESLLIAAVSPAGTCNGINIPIFSQRFLSGDFTPQERDFLIGEETGSTVFKQHIVEATFGGTLFELPAGEVQALVGASYRDDSIDDTPGINSQNLNFAGLVTSTRTAGSEQLYEVFGEIGVPLLREVPLIHSLDIVASGRYSSYDVSGDDFTYKGGVRWAVTPWLAATANYGTSFRGPNLFELFQTSQGGFFNIGDPCQEFAANPNPTVSTNCASLGIPDDFIPVSNSVFVSSTGAILPDGTSSITPETAKTFSAGLQLTIESIGLSATVQYTDIQINDQITTITGGAIVGACIADADNFPNNRFCPLITRNAATDPTAPFRITDINNSFVNIDRQDNRSLDFLVNFNRDIFGVNVNINAQATHQLEDLITQNLVTGTTTVDNRTFPNEFDWTGNAGLTLRKNGWSLFYGLDWVGPSRLEDRIGGNTFPFRSLGDGQFDFAIETSFQDYHRLSLTKSFDNGFIFRLGVTNLFDREPPRVSPGGGFRQIGNSALNSFDLRGRRIWGGIEKRF